ncbi:unnamed protein product [Rotaria socialis]|uniref:SURP motif domain-containing protein n=1 Tax=Rotaria socialis TaxID=392032 RepID=A0A818Z191_9BILA|nr:unnamed protein product [Rotaria socialis]CAF4399020.1 unnamed protein product [Rotaria socialis]
MSNINLFPELDNEQEQEHEYNNGHDEFKEEELIVFGYSCKLFRDDFSAKAIDRGQSLIPWNGDENVMIDRYDCRGHLSDLKLWDSDLIRQKQSNNELHFLSEEEKRIEEECDKERYLALYKDMEKEALQQEEEWKRLNADKTAYSQVGYTYDDLSKTKGSSSKTIEEVPQTLDDDDDDEYEPFYPSEKLQIPYGMDIPESIKLNAVIEKTASFVSTSGLQMEIVLKTKQANNPQFDFLKYDHYLNPYYRHLIIMIKSGKYRPNFDNNSTTTTNNTNTNNNNNNNNNQKKKTNKNGIDQNNSHDEDEGGDSYLHPLLRGSTNNDNSNATKKSDETSRKPPVQMNIHNTAYGQLIKKYEHLRQREKVLKENEEEKMSPKKEEIKTEELSPKSDSSSSTHVIPPPPDVKPIIDKLAEYVARNGQAFEQSIRTKNDPRFGFLERDHIHHNYYQLKLQLCVQGILRSKNQENQRNLDNDIQQNVHGKGVKLVLKTNTEESLTPTCQEFNSDDDSNSMQPKYLDKQEDFNQFIGPRPPSPEFLEKMRKQEQRRDRVSGFVRDKITRDKQEERKRKAEMLVQQLKTKVNESTSVINSIESSTTNSNINPTIVEKLLNVKNERSTSSILASSHQHRRSKHSRSPSKSCNRSKYHRRSRSKSNHRRRRRSSHKRSRSRSKSRSHHRSKQSKNSKSSKSSRNHRRHRHRRHRHSSASSTSSNSLSRSRSSSVSSSSSSSISSSSPHDRKKKKKVTNNDEEQQRNQRKNNAQSSKWDQREPTKVKPEASSIDTATAASSLSINTETTLSNSSTS